MAATPTTEQIASYNSELRDMTVVSFLYTEGLSPSGKNRRLSLSAGTMETRSAAGALFSLGKGNEKVAQFRRDPSHQRVLLRKAVGLSGQGGAWL